MAISIIFQVTRLASLMISISFASWVRDTIHLERVILTNHDNVIILRKMIGTTKIIVPVDVEVSLSVNCLYGDLTFSISPSGGPPQ